MATTISRASAPQSRPEETRRGRQATRRCLHEAFGEAVGRWPERAAVSDGGTVLTYTDLDQRANRLAHRLRALGAGPEVLVGLCVPRSADLIIGMLAILKAGAGYLPLDPYCPAARLAVTVADSGCTLMVGDGIPGVTTVRPNDASLADEPDTAPHTAVRPDNVAYVIYTSGSTGRPKGVVVMHSNVDRLFSVTHPEFDLCEQDVWTAFHSVAFDFSVWEIWGALLTGARLVIVPYQVSRDPDAFLRMLVSEGVTVLSQTPTAFRQLQRAVRVAGFPSTDLRLVVFGGEKLDPPTLRTWIGHYGDKQPRLVNMYGITETTVHVTIRPITASDMDRTTSPIGRPLADLRLYVLDHELSPVAPGQAGEIYVSGPGVSRGYLNRADLTDQRFLPDPFGPAGAVMYRSGDLAEIDGDKELVFLGRADRQIQLHGFRIEPAEIELIVQAHPDVRDAIVVASQGPSGDQRLACYWIPEPGAEPATVGLHAWAAARLPEYMIPRSFSALDEFPLTEQGKLDEARLAETAVSGASGGPRSAAGSPLEQDSAEGAGQPCGQVEKRLAEIWAELLEMDFVGTDENFFAVGGDSITAIELVAEARASDIPISIPLLFAHPTIAELARAAARR